VWRRASDDARFRHLPLNRDALRHGTGDADRNLRVHIIALAQLLGHDIGELHRGHPGGMDPPDQRHGDIARGIDRRALHRNIRFLKHRDVQRISGPDPVFRDAAITGRRGTAS
jgi:hypothetical protein